MKLYRGRQLLCFFCGSADFDNDSHNRGRLLRDGHGVISAPMRCHGRHNFNANTTCLSEYPTDYQVLAVVPREERT